jgi:3-keto-5-aminohexanoate cleavage enzyme
MDGDVIRETDWATRPVVIAVAPTGAEVTRADNPAVPYTPREIAASVAESCEAGAAIAHLHVREPDGTPSARLELFQECIAYIRELCDIVVMVSTGGAVGMSIEERTAGLHARPDMSGLEVGSINFGPDLFPTLPHESVAIAAAAVAAGAELELEVFEIGHVDAAVAMAADGILPRPLRFNLVLGVPGAMAATAHNLISLARALPDGALWGVTAVGRHQTRMVTLALLLGADCVRVGMEDNVYRRKGLLAASNAELVQDTVDRTLALGRQVATTGQARQLLRVDVADRLHDSSLDGRNREGK